MPSHVPGAPWHSRLLFPMTRGLPEEGSHGGKGPQCDSGSSARHQLPPQQQGKGLIARKGPRSPTWGAEAGGQGLRARRAGQLRPRGPWGPGHRAGPVGPPPWASPGHGHQQGPSGLRAATTVAYLYPRVTVHGLWPAEPIHEFHCDRFTFKINVSLTHV